MKLLDLCGDFKLAGGFNSGDEGTAPLVPAGEDVWGDTVPLSDSGAGGEGAN